MFSLEEKHLKIIAEQTGLYFELDLGNEKRNVVESIVEEIYYGDEEDFEDVPQEDVRLLIQEWLKTVMQVDLTEIAINLCLMKQDLSYLEEE